MLSARSHVAGISSHRGAQPNWLSTLLGRIRGRDRTGLLPANQEGFPLTQEFEMKQRTVSWGRRLFQFARVELGAVLSSPALYLFWFFVMSQSLSGSLLARGPFGTSILMTSGQHAAGAFNTLSLLVCLLLLFFMVDALERERATKIFPIVNSGPHRTSSLLIGKKLRYRAPRRLDPHGFVRSWFDHYSSAGKSCAKYRAVSVGLGTIDASHIPPVDCTSFGGVRNHQQSVSDSGDGPGRHCLDSLSRAGGGIRLAFQLDALERANLERPRCLGTGSPGVDSQTVFSCFRWRPLC